ncbi:hypothetical protein [Aneurinibacillus aneurinilyticus]|uniref:Uncharacterized protein n=1 Tax=Aneurinibacillus aneurinilyticus ATCC 12856 TaxID=649747 RepID=U1X424_ANEAE|nr:hypothetical protein [Aneurinibacillus aneurinilyticus]ERI09268.1 hypothetical protein HMPREF0083_02653 [Aneurinibacillus aneurinilyticus ATCC 12856]MED0704729.1 hypothetical protein [Aneurinibacillus aneurinilyticus]MED0726233.1 hypothetical protein [Aneurinibacillus aneurinilyticus]MED0735094.1 hypothetical protein [Aneurinibacillus aneurinilyticus]MED0744098.1 hypothetical protein [Aneurinibacillus aneurinilyticus]
MQYYALLVFYLYQKTFRVTDAQFITPKSSIRISSISGISSVKVTGTKTGAANERYVIAKSNVETGHRIGMQK